MNAEMIEKLKSMVNNQGRSGTWDYDPYMHGMFNGMELMLATVEGREPSFRDTPPQWLSRLPQPRIPAEQSAEFQECDLSEGYGSMPKIPKELTSGEQDCPIPRGSISDQVKNLEEAARCAQQMLSFLKVNYARGGIKTENDTMFEGALKNWEMRLSSLQSNNEVGGCEPTDK